MAKEKEGCDAPGCEDERGRGLYCKRHRVRLGNINFRRRKDGQPELDKLPADDLTITGTRPPRDVTPRHDVAPHVRTQTHVERKPRKAKRGGYKKRATPPEELMAEAIPTPAAVSGNGHVMTARQIALGELDKMIAALTSTRAIMASIPAEA